MPVSMQPVTEGIEALPLAGIPTDDGRLRRPASPAPPPTGAETRACLRALRSFHAGDHAGAENLAPPDDDVLPALLHPFRDPERVRIDYPLFLTGSGAEGADRSLLPLADLLARQIGLIAPGAGEAQILKDNVARLERGVRVALADGGPPVAAAPTLAAAGEAMVAALGLKPVSTDALRADLERLVASLPPGGRLLPLGEDATLHLLVAVAREAGHARRTALLDEVRRARATLREYLRLARSKEASATASDTLRDAIGATGAARLDTDALARMLEPKQAATATDAGLRDIVGHDVVILDGFLAAGVAPVMTVVAPDGAAGADTDADADTDTDADTDINRQCVGRDDVCRVAAEVFDRQAAAYAELFAALRTARLLAAGTYDPDRHRRLRAAFDWHGFGRQELLALPPVVAIESAPHLAGAGMLECSRLLRSGRPVEVLVRVQPATNPAAGADDPISGYRFELAYLGISHREVLVHQSSAARPDHLAAGFRRSLDAATGSLHVVTSGLGADGDPARLGAWMHAGAALGGRAHPFIHYDPEAGATWARRLDLAGNPQPEADWPVYELGFGDEDGKDAASIAAAFTFADFMLLEPRYRRHFRVVPGAAPENELAPLADHLAEPPGTPSHRVPFVWAADREGRAQRLVVDAALLRACRDRLDYWRTLQELAGIRNEHVREAVERERARLEEAFARERARLEATHDAEIARVREEEARTALRRLSESLLGIDVGAAGSFMLAAAPLPPASVKTAQSPPPEAPPADATAPSAGEAAPEPDDEAGAEEPWVDSVLCTSCNDCIDVNPRLFVYNANKQATIGDPTAGTYAQLVQAAEKCPARCIHPGRPLNADEPGLDALVDRAKPFNL